MAKSKSKPKTKKVLDDEEELQVEADDADADEDAGAQRLGELLPQDDREDRDEDGQDHGGSEVGEVLRHNVYQRRL